MAANTIFILSLKSSGSSLLQRMLVQRLGGRVSKSEAHYENETLFWTKAASVLGLKQGPMPNSRYPKNSHTAKRELVDFFDSNGLDTRMDLKNEADIFAAWTALVEQDSSVLIEKSPHHLYQPSNVALMERYADAVAGRVNVRFVGLIRNPMDTIYSSWRRFGVSPDREEAHWIAAYATLQQLQERRPDLVTLVRYEDCIGGGFDPAVLGLPLAEVASSEATRTSSLGKWRRDAGYGFTLSPAARALALEYGYDAFTLTNPHARSWAYRRVPRAAFYSAVSRLPAAFERSMRDTARKLLAKKSASMPDGRSALQS